MQNNYNINQLSLAMTTDYQPEENHPAYYIYQLVERLVIAKPNIMGRPREMVKLNPHTIFKLTLKH